MRKLPLIVLLIAIAILEAPSFHACWTEPVPVGAFDSSAINEILGLSEGRETVYIISVGAVEQ